MNLYWSYALAIIGILGLHLAGKRSYWGWAIGLTAQTLWIAYAIATNQPGFILSAIAYGAVYGRNLWAWRTEDKQAKASRLSEETHAASLSEATRAANWVKGLTEARIAESRAKSTT